MNDNVQRPLRNTSALLQFNPAQIDDGDEGPIALLRWMSVLAIHHKVKLILCTAAGIGLGALYAQSLPKTYTATASLLLEAHRQPGAVSQDMSPQGLDLNRADSELQIIRSERLLTTVFDSLHLENLAELSPKPPGAVQNFLNALTGLTWNKVMEAASQPLKTVARKASAISMPASSPNSSTSRQVSFVNFSNHLEARRVGQSYVVEIDYSSSDPVLAATVANAAVSAYLLQSVSFKSQMAIVGTEALQWRLNALASQVEAAQNAVKLGALPAIATPDADARVIGAALVPLNPSGPRSSLITILGAVLGLLSGFCLLALRLTFNRKIYDGRILSRQTGVAFLGSLPEASNAIDASFRPIQKKLPFGARNALSSYVTAIRNLRTSIEIVSSPVRKDRSLVLAVASWEPSNGASSLCLNLARLISGSGRKVTLFKAGTPPLKPLGEETPPTLADILTVNLPTTNVSYSEDADSDVSILNIYSNTADANLFADFRDRRVSKVIEIASNGGDVLLELPPLSSSSDALALAAHSNAVVIIVMEGRTTVDEVTDAIHQLRRAGANVIGTIISRAKA